LEQTDEAMVGVYVPAAQGCGMMLPTTLVLPVDVTVMVVVVRWLQT
jgi:hypothetical protein